MAVLIPACFALAAAQTAAGPDAGRGERLYEQRCSACHSVDADRVGPHHRGVFGRPVGRVPGYAYSPALQAAQAVWTAANLEAWLADPEQLFPGQRMGYAVPLAADRADIIAYLRQLASEPGAAGGSR